MTADLTGLGSVPAGDGNIFDRKRGFNAHSLSLSQSHYTEMTEILLKSQVTYPSGKTYGRATGFTEFHADV